MRTSLVVMALLCATTAVAQGPVAPIDPLDEWRNSKAREDDAPLQDFRFISYFFSRFSLTNMLGDPAGLRGVSLGPIGDVAGSAVRVRPDSTAFYGEQRWIPVIEYSPWFMDDLATFRAQFEVDFTWGLGANATQQNSGGGFNADMVNFQTKNINVAIYPTRRPSQLSIVIGTQPFYDNVNDGTRTGVWDIVRGGYKLSFLGTDGTGIQVFAAPIPTVKLRAGLLFIGAAQPDKVTADDPRLKFSFMTLLDGSWEVMPGTHIGLSGWVLRDDTKGAAYAFEGLVGSGPASTGLSNFTGTAKLPIEAPVGTVGWAGLNFQHNTSFHTGKFGASGFVMLNAGKYVTTRQTTTFQPVIDILGVSANLELLYNYGRTANDIVSLEGIFTTGDGNPGNERYTGAFTTNFYGLPGAVWFNHKSLLLFPFTSTVNNYTGAVNDISNQGYGITAGILAAAYDLIPNTLNAKVGAGIGTANATPPQVAFATDPSVTRGRYIGTEINAELKWTIRYLFTVGLHAAYLFRGDFYAGNPQVTTNPFALFTTLTWYAF